MAIGFDRGLLNCYRYSETMPTPGEMLKAWRESCGPDGLSQKECADSVDVTQATWSDWERDRKLPQIAQGLSIAKLTKGKVPITVWGNSPLVKARKARRKAA